jgi:hypothetical protein
VGKSERNRPLGKPRRRWEGNIKMDLQKVGRRGMDWIDLDHGRDGWMDGCFVVGWLVS